MIVKQDMLQRVLNLPLLRWRNDEMQPLIDMLSFDSSVLELGAFAGQCTIQFLKSPKVKRLVCVDTWKGGYDPDDVASGSDMDAAYQAFYWRTDLPEKTKLEVIKTSTALARVGLSDQMFDLVYIDANHRYENVLNDILMFRPLVKKGGILAGHDYNVPNHPGVTQAVRQAMGIPDKIFGDTSWMFRL